MVEFYPATRIIYWSPVHKQLADQKREVLAERNAKGVSLIEKKPRNTTITDDIKG